VKLTEVCLARTLTSLGFAPAAIHNATAVWRRSCGRSGASPAAPTAGSQTFARKFEVRSTPPRLGLFLDEAGNCAALSDLDVLATTARGQGIQLVTVWHDRSQLEARYGPKASTILNNHRAKLFLSGLADLSALELGARLIGDQVLVDRNRSMGSDGRHSLNESTSYRPLLPVEDLRRLRPGEGVLLYGHLRPTPIRLRPFYQPREQHRRERAEDRAARRLARAQRRLGRKTERAFVRMQRRLAHEQGQAATARVVWPQREGGRR
jgi:type IV secretory pathway TraG/TraD family ATPase VirD4